MFKGKLKRVDNDTSTDQEVESALAADNVRADNDTSADQEVESALAAYIVRTDNDTSADQEVESALAADIVRADNDKPADQEVESAEIVLADTPSDLEIASGSRLGLVRISEASPYTEETPPPYESIVLPVDSLPSYYDALAMSSPNCQMPVPLPAPTIPLPDQSHSLNELNAQLSTSAGHGSTVPGY